MSQIAQALSKAKERSGASRPPFPVPGQATKEEAAPPRKNTQVTWVILLSAVLFLTGLTIWFTSLSHEDQAVDLSAGSLPVSNPSATSAQPNQPGKETVSADSHTQIQDLVNALNISAVMPGEQPRIMIQGRVIGVGQVVESGLTFSGIQSDQLLFKDTAGKTHTRRF